jgi:hypothetical protein
LRLAAIQFTTAGKSVFLKPPISTDQQQPRGLAGEGFRRAMNAGRHGAAWPRHGDAPKIAVAKGKRLCRREGLVVKIVAVLTQKLFTR